jgi:hypothetical protein
MLFDNAADVYARFVEIPHVPVFCVQVNPPVSVVPRFVVESARVNVSVARTLMRRAV